MKVNILKPAAFLAMMSLAACMNEVIESPGNNNLALGQGEDVIRISLSSTAGTRAARPIGSSAAENNVNRIAFKFLTTEQTEVENIDLEGVIDEDGESVSGYDAENNVLTLPSTYNGESIRVKFSGLTKGSYKIIAYGYNYTAGTDGNDAFPYSIELKGDNSLFKCEKVTSVQEIFAGCNGNSVYVEVNQHNKFTEPPVITLSRQVAGLLAYFKDAPAFVNNEKVAKITVSSKANVTGFYLPASLLEKPSYNGISTDGWDGATWVNYLTFDMSKASNYNDPHLDSGDYYTFNNSFLLADETEAISGLACKQNTLFGSRFLLAYPSHRDFGVSDSKCATLNICYWDVDGDLILSVPLRSGGSEDDSLNASSYQYDIKCNNFYSIGTKTTTDDSDGNDAPISIDEPTGYDYANVSIVSDWSISHDLVN